MSSTKLKFNKKIGGAKPGNLSFSSSRSEEMSSNLQHSSDNTHRTMLIKNSSGIHGMATRNLASWCQRVNSKPCFCNSLNDAHAIVLVIVSRSGKKAGPQLLIIALQRHVSEWDVDAYALFHWAKPDEDLHGMARSM